MAIYEIEGKVFDLPSTLQGEDLKSLVQDIQDVMRAFGWNQSPTLDGHCLVEEGGETFTRMQEDTYV